jgi:hypothetical protein
VGKNATLFGKFVTLIFLSVAQSRRAHLKDLIEGGVQEGLTLKTSSNVGFKRGSFKGPHRRWGSRGAHLKDLIEGGVQEGLAHYKDLIEGEVQERLTLRTSSK